MIQPEARLGLSKTVPKSAGSHFANVSCEDLGAGIYFVSVSTGAAESNAKDSSVEMSGRETVS